MSDLWYYTKIGFLMGFGAVVLIMAVFAVLLGPMLIATIMYGDGWGVVIGLPWAVSCIFAGSFVIVMAQDGKIHFAKVGDTDG